VKGVEGRKLLRPTVTIRPSGNSPSAKITADEAELRSNTASGDLTIIFRNGRLEMAGNTIDFPEFSYDIPLDGATRKGNALHAPAHLSLNVLPERAAEQRLAIDRLEQELAAQAGYQMLTGEFKALAARTWAADMKKLSQMKSDLYKMHTEPPRRWANGFSCFCFTLVGASMAMRRKNGDPLASFFLCFLPILLVYYPLLAYGVGQAKVGAVHPYTVWLANACLVLWGAWLLRRVIRY
jgi:lipopolysaccharide export system permease protein